MTIGSAVRGLLGPRLERVAADGYRRMFVNLNDVATQIAGLGSFSSLVEVGCGEGALMTCLLNALGAEAEALGIDIAPNPGRNFVGSGSNVTFRQTAVQDLVNEGRRFDLVVVSDVLHHILPDDRGAFRRSCRDLMAPSGTIVVKEWVRRRNLAHAAAYVSDRYISGDSTVDFYSKTELNDVFVEVYCAGGSRVVRTHCSPHRNNVLVATTI